METGDRRVKKETRNDERRRGRARKAQERSENPEQLRDDTDVQTGDGKKMQCAGLLKWILDSLGVSWRRPSAMPLINAAHPANPPDRA